MSNYHDQLDRITALLEVLLDKVEMIADEPRRKEVAKHMETAARIMEINSCCDKPCLPKEKTTGLTFEEAMVFFRKGRNIARENWPGCWHANFQSKRYDTLNSTVDVKGILANDWEVRE